MTDLAPLWALCSLNDEILKDSTHPDFTFDYVDISNVTEGKISEDLESLTFGSAPSRARRLAQPDDIIISTVRTYLRAIARVEATESQRVYSTGFAVLRPVRGAVEPRYLAYVLTSNGVMDEIIATSVGVSYPSIRGLTLHRIRVPHSGLDTQRAIADYLDRETGEIDAMIAKLEWLAETLLARRKTLVLRGTRQDGLSVDCAADAAETSTLPDGWRLLPLKFAIEGAQTGVWGEEANGGDDDILCARVADFDRVKINVTEVPTVRRVPAKDREKCALRHGDILVEKSGGTDKNPVGTVVAYEGELPAVYANFVLRLRPLEDHHARFWLYALHGSYLAGRTWNFVRQTTGIQNLDVNGYLSMPHPVPDHDEQRRIADHLDEVTGRIDAMLAKVAELRSLLLERRAALITDVVTGRKKVA